MNCFVLQKSLLALAICASNGLSRGGVANIRANDSKLLLHIQASVSHRPVATTNAKKEIEIVWGTDGQFNPPDSGYFLLRMRIRDHIAG